MEFMDYVRALIDFIMKLIALFKNDDNNADDSTTESAK